MLELGLASSHAPTIFSPVETWDEIHRRLIRDVPPPPAFELETLEVQQSYRHRIDAALADLRSTLLAASPDALVIIGDDQSEVFGPEVMPALAVYVGGDTTGTVSIRLRGELDRDNHVALKTHQDVANDLAQRLTAEGFNPAVMRRLRPSVRPDAGVGHAFTRLANALGATEAGIPLVLIFLNSYHPPLPSGKVVYDLGKAIGHILEARPERIALLASGGLSHDPMGPRAGWIDQKLDRWLLDTIAAGQPEKLASLFSFESELFDGGTGEIRSWIATAAAFGDTRATIIDYIPVIRSVTGLGFARWKKEPSQN